MIAFTIISGYIGMIIISLPLFAKLSMIADGVDRLPREDVKPLVIWSLFWPLGWLLVLLVTTAINVHGLLDRIKESDALYRSLDRISRRDK